MRFFRQIKLDEDPAELLEPENQWSTPWGEPDHGPCDTCRGRRETPHECLSCLEDGAREDCPSCGGAVRFTEVCPTCEGTGEITRTRRRGISVFPSAGGLYRYLIDRDVDLDGTSLLELEGELTGDVDLDAECGAVLARPTEIVRVHPFDESRVAELRSRDRAG